MKLSEYIPKYESGTSFAKRIGVKDSVLSVWKSGDRPIPVIHCPKIERATGGLVTCEEMRPDFDWASIRNTGKEAA